MPSSFLDPFDFATSEASHAAPQRHAAMQATTKKALHECLGSLPEKTLAVIKMPLASKMIEIALPGKRITINRYFPEMKELDLSAYPLRWIVSDSYAYRERLVQVGIAAPVDSMRIMDAVLQGKDIDRFCNGEPRAEEMLAMFMRLGKELNASRNIPWYQLLRDAQPYIGSLPGFRVDEEQFTGILAEIGKAENQANTVTLWTNTLRQHGDHFPVKLIPGGEQRCRFTCKNPPLLSMHGKLRKALYASHENRMLIGVDFHQMQPRIIAERCMDSVFRAPFVNGGDYYRMWASFIFAKPEAEVSKEERSIAKEVALHWLFGQGEDNLSLLIGAAGFDKDLGLQGIRNFEKACTKLKRWKRMLISEVMAHGTVTIKSGHRIAVAKKDAKRTAMNYYATGTEVEIMLHAIMKLGSKLEEEKLDARISLLVYDELIVETAPECQPRVEALMQECLTAAFHEMLPNAPLTNLLEVHADPCWGNLK